MRAAKRKRKHEAPNMKLVQVTAAMLLATAAAAHAQQTETPANVPDSQSVCSRGYDATLYTGRFEGDFDSDAMLRSADTNRDGRISKAEFDNACAKNLFIRQERNDIGGG
jgi:hypothetical protein